MSMRLKNRQGMIIHEGDYLNFRDMIETIIREGQINLRYVDMGDQTLAGVDFTGCDLTGASFSQSCLEWANFTDTCLKGVYFGCGLARTHGIVSFGPVGNTRRVGYVVKSSKGIPMVQLGCFWGTLIEASTAIIREYHHNQKELNAYLGLMDAAARALEVWNP